MRSKRVPGFIVLWKVRHGLQLLLYVLIDRVSQIKLHCNFKYGLLNMHHLHQWSIQAVIVQRFGGRSLQGLQDVRYRK
jgi:hypothetical protein